MLQRSFCGMTCRAECKEGQRDHGGARLDLDQNVSQRQQEPSSSCSRERSASAFREGPQQEEPAMGCLPYSAVSLLLGLQFVARSWSAEQNERVLYVADRQAYQCVRGFCQGGNHSKRVGVLHSCRTRRPQSYPLQETVRAVEVCPRGSSGRTRTGGAQPLLKVENIFQIATADFTDRSTSCWDVGYTPPGSREPSTLQVF